MFNVNHKSSTVWLDDVDKNTTNVIGINLVGNILVLSICKYTETATGLSGMKIPSHSFNGFVGMSDAESVKLLKEILRLVYQEKYVYTQDWQDGQIVFMDQEITLHKRPTNVGHGSKRTMARVITYLDKLYPQHKPWTTVRFKGQQLSHEEFAKIIDIDRKKTFEEFELVN